MATDYSKYLPPNATQLEIDFVSTILEQREEIRDYIKTLRGFKYGNTPDNLLTLLINELGLGELTKYIDNPRRVIAEGNIWKNYQGTPYSVDLALSWIFRDELDELIEFNNGWHNSNVELKMGTLNSLDEVDKAVRLVKLSLPAGKTLARVFSGTDLTSMRWNSESTWNNALWNSPAGTFNQDLDVWVYINNTNIVFAPTGFLLEADTIAGSVSYTPVEVYGLPRSEWNTTPIPTVEVFDYSTTIISIQEAFSVEPNVADIGNLASISNFSEINTYVADFS